MAYQLGVRTRQPKTWLYLTAALVIIVILLAIVVRLTHKPSLLPKDIRKQVSFVTFYPDPSWLVDKHKITFVKESGVETIYATKGNTKLVINEQSAPSQFNDIPQFYPALLTKLNQFSSFGTANGTVNLVKPTELNGAVQAVDFTNGTLLFVKPNHTISETSWRQLFNNFQLVK